MTKAELIKLLEEYPDDALIVCPGNSDGEDYDDIEFVGETNLVEYDRRQWSGKYWPCDPSNNTTFFAIIIK